MTARRLCAIVGLVLFGVPAVAMASAPDQTWTVLAGTALILLAAAVRPSWAIPLAAAALVFAGPLQGLSGDANIAEKLLLSFLIGSFARLLVTRDATPSRLARPAIVLGLIVIGWAACELSAQQQATSWPGPFLADLWRHASTRYFSDTQSFEALHTMFGWVEALTLAVFVEMALRREPAVGAPAAHVTIVVAVGLSLFSLTRLAEIALRSETPLKTAAHVFANIRVQTLYTDVNAAASFYALFFVAALAMALQSKKVWPWITSVPLALALWLAGSRAAQAAAACGLLVVWLAERRRPSRPLMAIAALAIVVAGFAVWYPNRNLAVPEAAGIRVELAKAGLRVAAEHPFFGVGLGHFKSASLAAVPADVLAGSEFLRRGENAHNNFLQILVELGLAGLGAFMWMLVAAGRGVARSFAARTAPPELVGLAAGLLAFLVSCLSGHPLLMPHVLLVFFLVVGLTAGLAEAQATTSVATPETDVGRPTAARVAADVSRPTAARVGAGFSRPTAARVGAGFSRPTAGRIASALILTAAVVSVPWRVAAQRRSAVLRNVIIGASEVRDSVDGIPYRISDAHSVWYVPAAVRFVDLPLRLDAGSGADCAVALAMDGVEVNRAAPSRDGWTHVLLPADSAASRTHRIDVTIAGSACVVMVGELSERK